MSNIINSDADLREFTPNYELDPLDIENYKLGLMYAGREDKAIKSINRLVKKEFKKRDKLDLSTPGGKISLHWLNKRLQKHARTIKYFENILALNLDKKGLLEHRSKMRRAYIDNVQNYHVVFSFSVGRQTIYALLALTPYLQERAHTVLFADTGSEKPSTYEYLEKYIKPYCIENKLNLQIVASDYNKTLYQWYYDKKQIPTVQSRQCTHDFKIRPIKKYCREILKARKNRPVSMILGISTEEMWRMRIPLVSYFDNIYPLVDGFKDVVDKYLTAKDCIDRIKAHGWPEPESSACACCPYVGKKGLLDPRFKKDNIALEKNHKDYPNFKFYQNDKTLEQMDKDGDDLDGDDGGSCTTPFCGVG